MQYFCKRKKNGKRESMQ
jgi:hypothetical protein